MIESHGRGDAGRASPRPRGTVAKVRKGLLCSSCRAIYTAIRHSSIINVFDANFYDKSSTFRVSRFTNQENYIYNSPWRTSGSLRTNYGEFSCVNSISTNCSRLLAEAAPTPAFRANRSPGLVRLNGRARELTVPRPSSVPKDHSPADPPSFPKHPCRKRNLSSDSKLSMLKMSCMDACGSLRRPAGF